MNYTPTQKKKILSIVNIFETGKISGDYGNISIFHDGPNKIKQVTYGRSQTTEFGNLADLIKRYVDNKGQYASQLSPYLTKIGHLNQPLSDDNNFIQLLKQAGKDPIMQSTQDSFFDAHYFNPAVKWASDNGFTLPLSLLVIYDSYIHSGSIPKFLRDDFSEKVPVNGGDEKKWIIAYVEDRKHWLSTASNPILHNTVYRMETILDEISHNNWDLSQPVAACGILVP
jgi:chitosanase